MARLVKCQTSAFVLNGRRKCRRGVVLIFKDDFSKKSKGIYYQHFTAVIYTSCSFVDLSCSCRDSVFMVLKVNAGINGSAHGVTEELKLCCNLR